MSTSVCTCIFLFLSLFQKWLKRDFTYRKADFVFCMVIIVPKPQASVSQGYSREFALLILTARVTQTAEFEDTVFHKTVLTSNATEKFKGFPKTILRFDNLLGGPTKLTESCYTSECGSFRERTLMKISQGKDSQGRVWVGHKRGNYYCPYNVLPFVLIWDNLHGVSPSREGYLSFSVQSFYWSCIMQTLLIYWVTAFTVDLNQQADWDPKTQSPQPKLHGHLPGMARPP